MRSTSVFVNEENMALINCPYCESMKQVPVDKFKGTKHSLKVKCACGEVFKVDLNFRKNIRKKTDLAGKYYKESGHKSAAEECQVVNLSFRGVGLKIYREGTVEKDNKLIVAFTLDDTRQTAVERKVQVRHVEGSYVGAEFIDYDGDHLDKYIGFYLMN